MDPLFCSQLQRMPFFFFFLLPVFFLIFHVTASWRTYKDSARNCVVFLCRSLSQRSISKQKSPWQVYYELLLSFFSLTKLILAEKIKVQDPRSCKKHIYLPYSSNPVFELSRHALRPREQQQQQQLYVEQGDDVVLGGDPYGAKSILSVSALKVITEKEEEKKRTAAAAAGMPTLDLARRHRRSHRLQKLAVVIVFFLLLAGGIATFICWPRLPILSMDDNAESLYPAAADWGPDEQHPWFRATWRINVTLDNRSNWVPLRITWIEWKLLDRYTNQVFAKSETNHQVLLLPPRTMTPMRPIFQVNYVPRTFDDTTFQDLYNACGPKKMDGSTTSTGLDVLMQVCVSEGRWEFLFLFI